jgi:predicted Zn-dependent peptidase
LEVEAAKPEVQSYRIITEQIFGSEHPYGYNSTPERYYALNRQDILDHYEHFYQAGACKVFISGKVDDQILTQLREGLERLPNKGKVTPRPGIARLSGTKNLQLEQEGAVQTAIRLGLPLFQRSHPDYPALFFLNTLLGGYFGSRLMSNIREEKGYTYNISSSLDCMRYDGCWLISTEVSPEFAEPTKAEIHREMERLRSESVDPDEIEMVGNYVLGLLLSMLDGPFNVADAVKTLISEEAPLDFFEEMARLCQEFTADQLKELSRQYLDPDQLLEVSVGPPPPK